ncbi:2-hydroxy-3-oxopropionate reductase [hydrothermal vent metagenome]|uniref:2-hydroxy-3-oxopropionate reductase n=1 Tax=hydrothermal vent metagenome TaxID=652676 RepID=A0A3B0Y8W6_9ZZZZ
MKNIAILGLGAMGSRMAHNFLKQGYNLNVWNRSPEKCKRLVKQGAIQHLTPKEAAKSADIVFAMLTDDDASRDVWLNEATGALSGLKKNAIAIECSTLSFAYCLELSSILKDKGIQFLDAPVIGSRPQAEACQLIHLVGGDKSTLDKSHEILSINSSAVHYIGKVGSGMSMKLAVNGLFGIQVAALSEVLGMLNQLGLDRDHAVNILNELPTTSPALKGIGLAIIANNYAPLFPIDLVEKDFSYLLRVAESKSAKTPVVSTVLDVYKTAQKSGFGQDNIAGLVQLYL